ncbi:PREDICTED: leucine-rich repeat-containing protein 20 isoform X1 [Capra hircus]|uniref:leucine-rich repeat-containing protein 20 isoform X1 n=1 Tax=Capra hircus TaxID=9925 RepID=UPI00084698F4|nr:PREDICTED: leucine-rich repeat-containing protein 20 isoform X1 [Capra hircus]
MLRKMGEAVARVARKVNETVESGSDTLDLAECKLVSFPIGIYKVLRNVTDQIHLITLANNELKSLTSKFMTTFCQLRELRLEGTSCTASPMRSAPCSTSRPSTCPGTSSMTSPSSSPPCLRWRISIWKRMRLWTCPWRSWLPCLPCISSTCASTR